MSLKRKVKNEKEEEEDAMDLTESTALVATDSNKRLKETPTGMAREITISPWVKWKKSALGFSRIINGLRKRRCDIALRVDVVLSPVLGVRELIAMILEWTLPPSVYYLEYGVGPSLDYMLTWKREAGEDPTCVWPVQREQLGEDDQDDQEYAIMFDGTETPVDSCVLFREVYDDVFEYEIPKILRSKREDVFFRKLVRVSPTEVTPMNTSRDLWQEDRLTDQETDDVDRIQIVHRFKSEHRPILIEEGVVGVDTAHTWVVPGAWVASENRGSGPVVYDGRFVYRDVGTGQLVYPKPGVAVTRVAPSIGDHCLVSESGHDDSLKVLSILRSSDDKIVAVCESPDGSTASYPLEILVKFTPQ